MLNLLTHPAKRIAVKSVPASTNGCSTLAQARSGQQVTITGFGKLSQTYRQHLQAYGLLPGRTIRILAQRPVTIVLIEQTELAFETEIARQILIEA